MAYDQKKEREKSWKREYPVFKKFQEQISKEKLNKYGFDINIQNPRERRVKENHIRCGSGFEHAHVFFKGNYISTIFSSFSDDFKNPKINYLWIRHNWRSFIEEINHSRQERKLSMIDFERDGHQSLQSCIDELEELRFSIEQHFTK